jgi:tetratricopeptide (TPR) repeat protein
MADAAVGELTGAARAYLHRQVALALEPTVLNAAPSDPALLWACTAHWQAADEPERGLHVAVACAAYLLEIGRPTDAAGVFETAEKYARTDESRRICRLGVANALGHGGRWEEAARVLRHVARSDAERGEPDVSAWEAQLQLIEAEAWSGGDIATLIVRCGEYAADPRVSPDLRIRFATHGLRLADFQCSPGDIASIWERIEPLLNGQGVTSLAATTAAMIYHATVGSLDRALEAAESALAQSRDAGSSAGLSRALRSYANVAYRCGRQDIAMHHLLEAVAAAEAAGLVAHAVNSCGTIAERLMDNLQLAEAKSWQERCLRWLSVASNPASHASTRRSVAKLALLQHRTADAKAALAGTTDELSHSAHTAARVECLALHVHLHLQESDPDAECEVAAELAAASERVQSLGDHDYAAVVTFMLRARHDHAGALNSLGEYVRLHRRERGALPRLLTAALNGEPVVSRLFGSGGR